MSDDAGWQPVDHACRFCGHRVMRRGTEFRCFGCGASTMSGVVKDICGCGLAAAPGRFPFRCAPNPARSPSNPAEIVFIRQDAPAPTPRITRTGK